MAGGTTSSNATTGTTDSAWTYWNIEDSTAGTTALSSSTWECWVTDGSTTDGSRSNTANYVPLLSSLLSPDREQERRRKRKEADNRADTLLRSLLTPDQVRELDELSQFIVTTPQGRIYRIKRGKRVEELDEDKRVKARLCLHPRTYVPAGDTMLAQKLMLETDEDEFLRIANRTPVPMAA